jgi:hypothetical protein
MTDNLHERAQALLLDSWLGDLAPADQQWLRSHMESCGECAQFAGAIDIGVAGLRSAAPLPERAVVEATKRSVRLYAERLRETQSRVRMLAISCVLSVIWGGASLPLLWRGFAWLGGAFALPEAAWQAGFVLFWIAPSVITAVVLLAPKQEAARQAR